MAKKPAKKRICFFAMLVVAMLAAGYCLFLPRTLFDEPFSATVWSRDGRLMSAKVASDGQWRFFPTDSVPEKFRVAITTYEDKRFYRHFGVDPLALGRAVRQNPCGRADHERGEYAHHADHPPEPRRETPHVPGKVRRDGARHAPRTALQQG